MYHGQTFSDNSSSQYLHHVLKVLLGESVEGAEVFHLPLLLLLLFLVVLTRFVRHLCDVMVRLRVHGRVVSTTARASPVLGVVAVRVLLETQSRSL